MTARFAPARLELITAPPVNTGEHFARLDDLRGPAAAGDVKPFDVEAILAKEARFVRNQKDACDPRMAL